jgi:hypothetical protein
MTAVAEQGHADILAACSRPGFRDNAVDIIRDKLDARGIELLRQRELMS